MEIFKEKKWQIALGILATLVIVTGVFSVGVKVGLHRAGFSRGFGENYYRNFTGSGRGVGMMGGNFNRGLGNMMGERGIGGAYGLAGDIISINGGQIIVIDRDGIEKPIVIQDKTIIKRFSETIALSDLKIGDSIVVIGEPNQQGQVQAKLIRTMPASGSGNLEPSKQLQAELLKKQASTTLPTASSTVK
jgi:hypothetical protein